MVPKAKIEHSNEESNALTPIQERCRQQGERIGDSVAVLSDHGSLTFDILNCRSNQFARYLRKRAVGPGTIVAVVLERSIDSPAVLLGILKAGAAYLPIDPTYPAERIRTVLRDSQAAVLVTRRRFVDRIPADLQVLALEDLEIEAEDTAAVSLTVGLDDAAYVIYTSGSTGEPKGVVETHRTMVARLHSPIPDIRPHDVCGLTTSLSFGITASRLFLPLAMGARVVILDDNCVRDSYQFSEAVERYQITSIFAVPAFLRELLDLENTPLRRLRSLRVVAVGGGPVTPDLVRSFRKNLPETLLVNLYGSTEIGTTAAMRILSGKERLDRVPIGKPAANTRIYILDSSMNAVQPGAVGEIYVGSPHLAQGYLNRPDLTREVFVPDPFSGTPRARLCRTGDLGRYLPDGEIEFVGRVDHQVKLRGYRVELGEIEAVLQQHDSVRDTVATVRNEGTDQRLVAYLVPKPGISISVADLRAYLGRLLPDYMIPSAFVVLRGLPLTAAGKVDRLALPPPVSPDILSESPASPEEVVVMKIWAELLGQEHVGLHRNFLEAGGDSLVAMRICTRIRERMSIELPVARVFEKPTIAEFAAELTALKSSV